jgi:2-methylcitrate dehydratase PrpD
LNLLIRKSEGDRYACTLLRKSVKPSHFAETAIRDNEFRKLVDKMKLLPDVPPDKELAAKICVRIKNGRIFNASTDVPTGQIFKNPLSDDEIASKFHNNVVYSGMVNKKKEEKSLEMILNLEEIKDVGALIPFWVK